MKIDPRIKVYGDLTFRDKKCPVEQKEHITFVNQVRKHNPNTLLFHVKNEGKRTLSQAQLDKAEGMQGGVSDIIIPGNPTFVCEIKRQDHTICSWQPLQQEYLIEAQNQGCFSCVSFGWKAAFDAYLDWCKITLANNIK